MKTNERMKLDYISPGQQFKNYKMLCSFLGISPHLHGKSRQLQIKRIKKYIDYEKEGQSIFITDVNEKPLAFSEPVIIESENPHTLYFKYIQLILMQTLTNNKYNGEICITNTGLFKMLGLVNENYGSKRYERKLFAIYPELKNMKREYYYIKEKLHRKLIDITECALESLEKQSIIEQRANIRIFSNDREMRLANLDEIISIETIEQNMLKRFYLKNAKEACLTKSTSYYKAVLNELEKIDIHYYRREKEILFNDTVRVKPLPNTILTSQKTELNLQLQSYLSRACFEQPLFSDNSSNNYLFAKKIISDKIICIDYSD